MRFGNMLLVTLLSLTLVSTANATNGDNMIGFGPVSKGMGGVGIAYPLGPESALKNPAMMRVSKKFEFIFAGTYFSPSVEIENETAQTSAKSKADNFAIPSIGFNYKISEKITFGLGAFGTSGLGVDYRDTTANDTFSRMSTSLSLLKFAPALAYASNNFSVGMGLSIMYGSLAISYDRTPNTTSIGSESPGSSDDLGLGYDIGAAYKLDNITLGFNYQSPIAMEYVHQLTDAAADFQLSSEITSDRLEQPAEIGTGVSYYADRWSIAFDYKQIQWAEAEGYSSFGWDNQNVMAFGLSLNALDSTWRLGYNHANTPLGDEAIGNSTSGARGGINYFNANGFPATVESHITFGWSKDFSDEFALDLAYVYAPETTTETRADLDGPGSNPEMVYKVKHSQTSVTVGGRWTF